MSPLTVSILTPVYNTDPAMLRDAIESVLHQTHERWQLCLVDDASTRQDTRDVLNHYAHFEPRVSVHYRSENGGISAASNDALAMAEGDILALLDHDDVLAPTALARVLALYDARPELQVVYTDEDKFDRPGHHFDPHRKPTWSPDVLLTQMFVGHLLTYRRRIVEETGGFRLGLEGSQDWDLLLRVTERTQQVGHVPEVLYHWRVHRDSTARAGDAKPYARLAAERALNEALARRGVRGHVEELPGTGYFQVRRQLRREPLITVVIPTAGQHVQTPAGAVCLVDGALDAVLTKNDYPQVEVVVVLSPGMDPAVERDMRLRHAGRPITWVSSTGRFDFSRAINRGAAHGAGELILLLNDDVEALGHSWLRLLVEALEDPVVGACGPRLLYPDGRVQHAGVQNRHDGMPYHLHMGLPDGPGPFGEVHLTREYMAVTGAVLLTRRDLFERAGGLSPLFPMNYNDIDYCLKVRQLGQRVLYIGQSVLRHHESATRPPTVTIQEIDLFQRYWADQTGNDLYYPLPRIMTFLQPSYE